MTEIVRGMKSADIGIVAHSLSAAVNAQVKMPDPFLATVKQWMTSRQESVAAASQMQLAQFIGHQAWTNQLQSNMQNVAPQAAQASAAPAAAGAAETAPAESSSFFSAPMGDSTPTILGGKTPALTGAQTPTVVPSEPMPTDTVRTTTEGTSTVASSQKPGFA